MVLRNNCVLTSLQWCKRQIALVDAFLAAILIQDLPAYRRWPRAIPIAWAFCRRAPAVRFIALAIDDTALH